ncbi:putative transcriptional regulator, AsnC family [Nocardia nova SH22a]|uniref:Putative transcriptional regulator, AsnC family n=1 Tax=Nocardia nova SH22a TaxID=1415166 RepID=W5TNR5_9NOCA|nr:Lrp/AsnC family transcriptional regulator [Nocardia nova]AHH21010.1 putative transcriptional regulator, AsnC family [Nocardia nova SH22a]
MPSHEPPDTQDLVDELDLQLINCLQFRPRASWAVIARVLGVDPVTVARRWERLERAGLAWVTCYYSVPSTDHVLSYVEIEVAGASVADVAVEVARHDYVASVHHTTGPRSLVVGVVGPDPAIISKYVSESLCTIDGIAATRAEIVTGKYGNASEWRLQALSPAQRHALQSAYPRPVAAPTAPIPPAEEQRILRILAVDGRMSTTDLARRLGVSEATARRRVNRLFTENGATIRCELSQRISGWPQTGILWSRAPIDTLDTVARALATLPVVRACLTTTGRNNIMLFAWLRDVQDMHQLEQAVSHAAPAVEITDRAFCLRSFKRIGTLIDDSGRNAGHPGPPPGLSPANPVAGPSPRL